MMRWITDIEGCVYTCSCLNDLRVRFALNLLCLGAKGWWKFMIADLSPMVKAIETWDQFFEMFLKECVPLVERKRLDQEYLLLWKTTDTVTQITMMFHEIDLFCPEYASQSRDMRPVQLQLATKQVKPVNSRAGGHRIRTCSKCEKVHEVPY